MTMMTKDLVASVLISTVMASLLSWWLTTRHLEAMARTVPPPVAVVSFPELNKQFYLGISEEAVEKAYDLMSEEIARYSNSGFVVLDGRYVLEAPKDVYVPVPDIGSIDELEKVIAVDKGEENGGD